MKIHFPIANKEYTEYCSKCFSANTTTRIKVNGDSYYECSQCQAVEPRAIIIDPKLVHWLDNDYEYCHKSVGLFLFNDKNQFLMFKLNKFPFGWTIPAGHIDINESPTDAARREAKEESGIEVSELKHLARLEIDKDGCRRGADRHYWEVYRSKIEDPSKVVIDSNEGGEFEWISVEKASARKNCFAVDYILSELSDLLAKDS